MGILWKYPYFDVFLPLWLVSFGMILMGDWGGCLNAYVCTHFGGSGLAFGMVWAGEWKWVRMIWENVLYVHC